MSSHRTILKRLAFGLVASVSLLASGAGAEEWTFVGARYQAMGGAGVATVNDAHASYWNPGAQAFARTREFEVPFSFTASVEGDILEDADVLADFVGATGFQNVLGKIGSGQSLTNLDLQQALQLAGGLLPRLEPKGEGFLALPDLGFVMQEKRLTVSVRLGGSFGVDPLLDLSGLGLSQDVSAFAQVTNVVGAGVDRTAQFLNGGSQSLADAIQAASGAWSQNQAEELVYQAEQAGLDTSGAAVRTLVTSIAGDTATLNAGSLDQNGSGVWVRGLLTQELGVGYAHPLFGDRIGIGGTVKVLRGTTFAQFVQYDDIQSGTDLVQDLTDFNNRQTSYGASLDLGLLVRATDRMRIGVVAHNLNSPRFDSNSDQDVKLQAQVRAGIAMDLLPGWVVAADVDLTENDSDTLDGFQSRLLSVGTEYRIPVGEVSVAFRTGAFTNLSSDVNRALTLTGGIGLQIWRFQFDLAVGASPRLRDIESSGSRLPERFNVSGALRWVTDL